MKKRKRQGEIKKAKKRERERVIEKAREGRDVPLKNGIHVKKKEEVIAHVTLSTRNYRRLLLPFGICDD